jgi:hypothetical protein
VVTSQLTPVERFWLQWHAEHGEAAAAAQAVRLLGEAATAVAGNGPPGGAGGRPIAAAALQALPPPAATALPHTRHGDHVAAVAALVFDATRPVHQQPATARPLLLLAARLHDFPHGEDGSEALRAADVLSEVRLADLSRARQAVLVAVLRLAQLGASKTTGRTEAGLKPAQWRQARTLAALLQLADALDESEDQSTRVEEITLEDEAVEVRLGGPGAAEAARCGKRGAALWQPALKTRLRLVVAPLSAAELVALAGTGDDRLTLTGGIQRVLASRLVCWQTALETAASQPSVDMAAALRATTGLRQALAALQPVLKRKPTQALRAALGGPEKLLRAAVDWHFLSHRVGAAKAEAKAEAEGQLQPLADAAGQSQQQAAGMAVAWLHGPGALELAETLVDFVSCAPVRQKQTAPLGHAARAGLSEAVEAMAQAQAGYSVHDPRSWRSAQRAALRCRVWLELLSASTPGRAKAGATAALAADLERLVEQLDTLRQMETADGHLGVFLERWAVRQARRKAPQLHGAEAVLALRQAMRRERQQQQRGVAADWRPVRAGSLRQRMKQLGRGAAQAGRQR